MSFIPKQYKSASSGGNAGPYMSPNKVKADGQMRFALLQEEPLCYFECWGEPVDGGSPKPFRFADEPSPADIEAEMGPNYQRRENDGKPEPVKFALSVPIYNFDAGKVQTFSMTQKGLQKELDEISQLEDYSDLLCWDFILTKAATNSPDMYGLRPVPRKKDTQKAIDAAWSAAVDNGYDINRMLTGGQPHIRD